MINRITSIFAGVFVASLIIFAIESLSHSIYPTPTGLDMLDKVNIEQFLKTSPAASKWLIILAWFLGSLVGTFTTKKLSRQNSIRNTLITGSIIFCFTLINLLMIYHPAWMLITGLMAIVSGAAITLLLSNKTITNQK
ncbi:MAG: hypothetical protein IPQ10_01490 [Saprospiraceae bacterium]|jgi:hypothetical protein|nr:hypothetical protein [Saprospiraceae bacterium]MBL0259740.1 hypothetical protein [Saprospiraceae bacterium]